MCRLFLNEFSFIPREKSSIIFLCINPTLDSVSGVNDVSGVDEVVAAVLMVIAVL